MQFGKQKKILKSIFEKQDKLLLINNIMRVSKVSAEYYTQYQANITRMQETARQTKIELDRKTVEKQRIVKLDPGGRADMKLGRHIDIEV